MLTIAKEYLKERIKDHASNVIGIRLHTSNSYPPFDTQRSTIMDIEFAVDELIIHTFIAC